MIGYAIKQLVLVVSSVLLWLCSGCGGGSDSPILSVSTMSISVSHVLGGEKGRAQFTVSNGGGGSLSYTIQGDPLLLSTASRIQGTLTSGEEHTIMLALGCDEPGTFTDSVTIQANNGTSEIVLISVTCTAPPIVLQVQKALTEKTGTPVAAPAVQMIWSFSSSWSGQGEVDYFITSDHGRAYATPSSGSAALGEAVAIDLTYDCEALGNVTIVWTISAKEQQVDTEWDVVCAAPSVVIAINGLADAVGTPLFFPSETLQWRFTSPWDGHGAEEYVIESDVELALPDPASGLAEPGDRIAVKLIYQCRELGAFKVTWTLRVGDQRESVVWHGQCVAPPVAIAIDRITLENVGILPNGATGLMRWSFTSDWKDHGAEQFEIRSSDHLASATPSRGSAHPKEVVTIDLTYACALPEAKTVTWSIIIGEQNEETNLVMNCHAPPITLTVEEIEDSSALVDEDTDGQLRWFFTSPWSGQGPVEYTISTDDTRASIERASGSASLNEVIVGRLTFACEDQGDFLVAWTVQAGEVEGMGEWRVRCAEISFLIQDVADSRAVLPDPAQGDLRWSYSLSPPADLELDFSIVADDVRASVRPANGRADPGEVVRADLTFDCSDVDVYTVELTVDLASRQEQVSWEVACVVPSIQIAIEDIEDSVALLDKEATGQMNWSFTSPWDGQGPVDYTVTASDNRASATPSGSTAAKDTMQRIELVFDCRDLGDHYVTWTVHADGVRAQAIWKVTCQTPPVQVEIQAVADSSATLPAHPTGTLSWKFTSPWSDQPALSYSLTSSDPLVRFDPASGTVQPDTTVNIALTYVCTDPVGTTASLVLNVGGQSATTSWKVTCRQPPIQIEVQAVADSSATLPVHPTGTLSWRFTSPWSDQPALNYSLASSDLLVQFSPASGTAQPDTTVNIALTYVCTDPVGTTASLVLNVGGQSATTSWKVTCRQPPIQIEVQAVADSSATLPVHPTGTLSWKFTSPWSDQPALNYSLASSDLLVQFSPASGTARPDTMINVALTYACTDPVDTTASLVLRMDGQNATTSWKVTCEQSPIQIKVQEVADSSATLPVHPTGTLSWRFTSPRSDQPALNYSLASSDPLVQFSPASGTARPDTTINVALTYACTDPVDTAASLVLRVGGQSVTTSWKVTCEQSSIQIEVQAVADSSATLPIHPTGTLSWRFTSPRSDQPALNYSLASSDPLVQFSPASGTAQPDTTVNVTLTYRCANPVDTTVSLVLHVDGYAATTSWIVECLVPEITIVIHPINDSAGSLGAPATGVLLWEFTSPWPGQGPVNYAVSSSDSRASAVPFQGSASKGIAHRVSLSYACQTSGDYLVTWTLHAAGVQAQSTWNVECTASFSIVIVRAPGHRNPMTQMEWMLQSGSGSQDSYSYSISTDDSRATASPSSGTVTAGGANITTALRYNCDASEDAAVTITITVATVTRLDVPWQVVCSVDVLRIGRIELFQSPMIARARRMEGSDGTVSFDKENMIDALTHRSTAVAVTVEHKKRDEQRNVSAKVRLADGRESSLIKYGEWWMKEPSSTDSQLWESTYIFFMDNSMIVSTTSLTVNLTPHSTDGIRSTEWNFSDLTFKNMPNIKFKFFRLETSEGVAPAIDQHAVDTALVRWAREVYPIVGFSTTIFNNEVITPPDKDEFDINKLLNELHKKWVSKGSIYDEYYYGGFLLPRDKTDYRAAYVSGNIAVTSVSGTYNVYEGWDYAHGLGHNFSLRHSDCGSPPPGDLDPDAPAGGKVGPNLGWSYGYATIIYRESNFRDIMSNCTPPFVSDYSYKKALAYLHGHLRKASSTRNMEASHPWDGTSHTAVTKEGKPARSIALTGSIDALNHWVLDLQAYNQHAPLPISNTGSHTLKLFDSTGNVVLTQRIDTYQLSHGPGGAWGTRVRIPSTEPVELVIYDQLGVIVLQEDLNLSDSP